jgi:putative endonuclease
MSENPDKRLKEHNSGKTRSTKGFVPWKIFFSEHFKTRAEEREIFLKAGSGKEKIKALWSKSIL